MKTVHNSRFAKAGVLCFYESEVLNSSLVHLITFSAKNPVLRQYPNRCASPYDQPCADNEPTNKK